MLWNGGKRTDWTGDMLDGRSDAGFIRPDIEDERRGVPP